jgi:hypothetical protein
MKYSEINHQHFFKIIKNHISLKWAKTDIGGNGIWGV